MAVLPTSADLKSQINKPSPTTTTLSERFSAIQTLSCKPSWSGLRWSWPSLNTHQLFYSLCLHGWCCLARRCIRGALKEASPRLLNQAPRQLLPVPPSSEEEGGFKARAHDASKYISHWNLCGARPLAEWVKASGWCNSASRNGSGFVLGGRIYTNFDGSNFTWSWSAIIFTTVSSAALLDSSQSRKDDYSWCCSQTNSQQSWRSLFFKGFESL